MTAPGFRALEHAEFEAFVDFYRAAPEAIRAAHEIEVCEVGGATCLS